MQPYLIEFSILILIFTLALLFPRVDLTVVLQQAFIYGCRNACVTPFGISSALLLHITYTILIIGLVISKSLLLSNLVQWAVIYLVYIGIEALSDKGSAFTISGGDKNGRLV